MLNLLDSLMILWGIFYIPIVLLYNQKPLYIQERKFHKYLSFYWNMLLAIFSIWGTYNTLPVLINSIYYNGLNNTIIGNNIHGSIKLQLLLFAPSKILELGDTLLLMIKFKKIRFIQYYHHYVTMLYCWHANYNLEIMNINSIFCIMNYTIHAFMYSWYSLSALGFKFPIIIKHFITILQTLQMFMGIYTVIIGNYLGNWYKYDLIGSIFASLMYYSYCILFTKLLLYNLISSKNN